jgi:hypothetical protein
MLFAPIYYIDKFQWEFQFYCGLLKARTKKNNAGSSNNNPPKAPLKASDTLATSEILPKIKLVSLFGPSGFLGGVPLFFKMGISSLALARAMATGLLLEGRWGPRAREAWTNIFTLARDIYMSIILSADIWKISDYLLFGG